MKPLTYALVTVVLGCLLSLSAYAQESRWGKPDEATVKLIKASEKMWLDGDCSPQPGLKDVFADDFQGTAPSGERYGKKDAMATPIPRPPTAAWATSPCTFSAMPPH